MSRTNETRHIEWHETCKSKCRLGTSVCNNKQRWNECMVGMLMNGVNHWYLKKDVIGVKFGTRTQTII